MLVKLLAPLAPMLQHGVLILAVTFVVEPAVLGNPVRSVHLAALALLHAAARRIVIGDLYIAVLNAYAQASWLFLQLTQRAHDVAFGALEGFPYLVLHSEPI